MTRVVVSSKEFLVGRTTFHESRMPSECPAHGAYTGVPSAFANASRSRCPDSGLRAGLKVRSRLRGFWAWNRCVAGRGSSIDPMVADVGVAAGFVTLSLGARRHRIVPSRLPGLLVIVRNVGWVAFGYGESRVVTFGQDIQCIQMITIASVSSLQYCSSRSRQAPLMAGSPRPSPYTISW